MTTQDESLVVPEILTRISDAYSKSAALTLNNAEIAALATYVRRLTEWAQERETLRETDPEKFRRERSTLDAVPVRDKYAIERRQSDTNVHAATLDYGSAGNLIDRAIHHLDEALPTGQRRRAELAFGLLRRGTEELAVWMRAKGYQV